MHVSELFERCVELADVAPSRASLRYLHETLVLACAEALRGSRQAFGNVFAQVDYLCKQHSVAIPDRIAIQQMRRHSNGKEQVSQSDWRYDIRALSLFISAIFHEDIPHDLLTRLPAQGRQQEQQPKVNLRYIRCIVDSWDERYIYASTADGPICVQRPTLDVQCSTFNVQRSTSNVHRGYAAQPAGLSS